MTAAADERKAALTTTATAQAKKPFAVSRKNTSSECTLAHFVRSRPVKYPPKPDETISMLINHTMAAAPTAEARIPSFDHGETGDRPNPAPNANKIRYKEAAVNAPPITVPHDTPEECDSWGNTCASGW